MEMSADVTSSFAYFPLTCSTASSVSTCHCDDGANCCTSDVIFDSSSGRSASSATIYARSPRNLIAYEVVEQLADELLDVAEVDEREDDLEGAAADGGVALFEAAEDGGAMARDGGVVDLRHLEQHRQRHVADVAVAVQQELPEDVGAQHALAAHGVDAHDGLHGLVEHRVARHARTVRLGRDLRVIARFAALTRASRSPSWSLLSASFVASRQRSLSSSTWRKGSGTPPMLYSLLKLPLMITFIFLMSRGTNLRNFGMYEGALCRT